ncbi:MAG: hypothetical protein Q8O19_01310 [Rectinemataceae bacterium]|nr:hypothetical protein [Rectinemataceae bacterium]
MILKVVQVGRCVAVIIPKKIRTKLGIKTGDHISLSKISKVREGGRDEAK